MVVMDNFLIFKFTVRIP